MITLTPEQIFNVILVIIGIASTVVIAYLFKFVLKPEIEKNYEKRTKFLKDELLSHIVNKWCQVLKIETATDKDHLNRILKASLHTHHSFEDLKDDVKVYLDPKTYHIFEEAYSTPLMILDGFTQGSEGGGYDYYVHAVNVELYRFFTRFRKIFNKYDYDTMESIIVNPSAELSYDEYRIIFDRTLGLDFDWLTISHKYSQFY